MAENNEWRELRAEHDAAWQKYLEAAERVHNGFEKFDNGIKEQPSDEDVGELETAWKRLENARRRIDALITQRSEQPR